MLRDAVNPLEKHYKMGMGDRCQSFDTYRPLSGELYTPKGLEDPLLSLDSFFCLYLYELI